MNFHSLFKPAALVAGALSISAPALADFRFDPYGAVNAGIVRLSPDPGSSGLTLTEETSAGFNGLLGFDITDRWAAEAAFSDLGTATLSGAGLGDRDIDYTAFSLSAVFHALGDPRSIAERQGAWTYLRLGVNKIENDSELVLEEANNTAIWAGVGFEWSMTSSLALRAEVATFDGDVQALTAGVVLRPFTSSTQRQRFPNPVSTPQPSAPVATAPAPRPVPAPAPAPQQPQIPNIESNRLPIPTAPQSQTLEVQPIADGSRINSLGCERPVGSEPAGSDGCALLSGVRRDIQFIGDTDQLTQTSMASIGNLATIMLTSPQVRIEIRAHAQSRQGPAAAQDLSKRRAVAVARAFVANGVGVERLGARAFGDREPVIATGTFAGEMLVNRIELAITR